MEIIITLITIIMATIVFTIRMKASKKPTSFRKIILPPFFMSTGFAMFLIPAIRVDMVYALEAFIFGTFLSFPLIATSKFEYRDSEIYLKRSRSFIFVIAGLLLFRLYLKAKVGEHLGLLETSGLFFILAFGMILSWRIVMLVQFQRLNKKRMLENTP
jgi:membrane protein CcdC involved in cytochrome C biogenesis